MLYQWGGWLNRHFRPPVSALILFQNSNFFDFHTFDKKRCTYLQDFSNLNPTARTRAFLNLSRFNHPPFRTQPIKVITLLRTLVSSLTLSWGSVKNCTPLWFLVLKISKNQFLFIFVRLTNKDAHFFKILAI